MIEFNDYIILQLNIITDIIIYETDKMESRDYVSYKNFKDLIGNLIIQNNLEFDKHLNTGELIVLNKDGSWEVVVRENKQCSYEELVAFNEKEKEATDIKNLIKERGSLVKKRILEMRRLSKGKWVK